MALDEGGAGGGPPLTQEEIQTVINPPRYYRPPSWRTRRGVGWDRAITTARKRPQPTIPRANVTVEQRVANTWDNISNFFSGSWSRATQEQITSDAARATPTQDMQERIWRAGSSSPTPGAAPTFAPTATPTATPTTTTPAQGPTRQAAVTPTPTPTPIPFQEGEDVVWRGDERDTQITSAADVIEDQRMPPSNLYPFDRGAPRSEQDLYWALTGLGSVGTGLRPEIQEDPAVRFAQAQYVTSLRDARISQDKMAAEGGDFSKAIKAIFTKPENYLAATANPIAAAKAAVNVLTAANEIRKEGRQFVEDTSFERGMDKVDATFLAVAAASEAPFRKASMLEDPDTGISVGGAFSATFDQFTKPDRWWINTGEAVDVDDIIRRERASREMTNPELMTAANEAIAEVNEKVGAGYPEYESVEEFTRSNEFAKLNELRDDFTEIASINSVSGPEAVEAFMNNAVYGEVAGQYYAEQAAQLLDLATSPESPLGTEERSQAALLANEAGQKAAELERMTYADIHVDTMNPLKDLAAGIAIDPLWVFDIAGGILGLSPQLRRINKAMNIAQEVADPADIARARGISNLATTPIASTTIDAAKAANVAEADTLTQARAVESVLEDIVGTEVEKYARIAETTPTTNIGLAGQPWAVLPTQRTAEALSQRTAEAANSILNYLSLGVENSLDFTKLVKTFIDSAEDLAKPVDGFIAQNLNGRKWDSRLLFNDRAENVRHSFRAVADDLLPLLNNVSPNDEVGPLIHRLEDAAAIGQMRRNGVETKIARQIPFTTTETKAVKEADKWLVQLKDANGDIVGRIPAVSKTNAQNIAGKANAVINYYGNRLNPNPVRKLGRALREIASQVYIIGNWSVIINNSASASTHSLWDGTFTLLGRQAAAKQLDLLTGAAAPSRRIETRIGGIVDAADIATSGEEGARTTRAGKTAEALRVPQPIINAFQTYGDTAVNIFGGDVYLGRLPVGEEANVFAQSAQVASKAMHDAWSSFMRNDASKAIDAIGIPDEIRDYVRGVLKDVPDVGLDATNERLFGFIDGVTDDAMLTLDDLGAENISSLTPVGKFRIVEAMSKGAGVDEIVNLIDEDMRFWERMMLEVPSPTHRKTFTDKDLAAEVADIMDDLNRYGRKAGVHDTDVRNISAPLAQRIVDATNKVRDIYMQSAGESFAFALEFSRRLERMTVQTRTAIDNAFMDLKPQSDKQWKQHFKTVNDMWVQHADNLDAYAKEAASKMADLASGKTTVGDEANPSIWDKASTYYEKYLEPEIQALRSSEARAALLATGEPNPHYKAVIEANQMFTDHYAETLRTIFRRYPGAESFDIVIDAERNVQAIGHKVAARMEEMRRQLFETPMPYHEFITRRNRIYRESADLASQEYLLAAQAITDNFVKSVANTTDILKDVDLEDAKAVREAMTDIRGIANAALKDLASVPFRPKFPNLSDAPDDIRRMAANALDIPTATEQGVGFDNALINFYKSDKVRDTLEGYEFVYENIGSINLIDDLSQSERKTLHQMLYAYAYETGENLPDSISYLKQIADDDLAKGRAAKPMSQQELEMFGLEAMDELVEQYNQWSAVRLNSPMGVDPTVSEMAEHHVAMIENATKALGEAAANKSPTPELISPKQRADLFEWINTDLRENHSAMAQGSLDAAKEVSSFTMINHAGSGRYWDDWVGMVAPFHFFFTRSGKNMLERMVFTPGRMSAWQNTVNALDRRDEQRGDADSRMRNTIDLPFASTEDKRVALRFNIDRSMPFAPGTLYGGFRANDTDLNTLQRIGAGMSRFGLGLYAWADPGGLDIFATPQTAIAMQAAMAAGADGRMMDMARRNLPEWAMVVTAKEAAYMGMDVDGIRDMQEVGAYIVGSVDEYMPGFDEEGGRQKWSMAEKSAWRDRLWAQVSGFFLPVNIMVQKRDEKSMSDTAQYSKMSRYHDEENIGGSKMAYDLMKDMYPEEYAYRGSWSIFAPTSYEENADIDPNASYFTSARDEIEFDWVRPNVAGLREKERKDKDLAYNEMNRELLAWTQKLEAGNINEREHYNGVNDIKGKYIWDDDSVLNKLKVKYAALDDYPYSDNFNPYPYLAPHEAKIKVSQEVLDTAQDLYTYSEYPGTEAPYSEYLSWAKERDEAVAKQNIYVNKAMSELSTLVAITAEASKSGLAYPFTNKEYDSLTRALVGEAQYIEVTSDQLQAMAKVQNEMEAEGRWPDMTEEAGIIPGDTVAEGLQYTQKYGSMPPTTAAAVVEYLEDRKSSGSGGGGRRGGRGGRRGRGGGGGGGSYAALANVRVDAYQGLGAGLMQGYEDRQWQPGQSNWRWFAEPERTPLPRYRSLGR